MFLDTSGLLCFIDEADSRHREAQRLMAAARLSVTHSLVLAELIPLSRRRRLRPGRALSLVSDIVTLQVVETVWVTQDIFRAGLRLLNARADKHYSLCDAVSFLVMRERGLTEAFTTDHHFDQEGFQRLLDR
ncbi:MAG: PIN domain-containing protein [Pirellulales bacterium]